jgi:hypothetical protein
MNNFNPLTSAKQSLHHRAGVSPTFRQTPRETHYNETNNKPI